MYSTLRCQCLPSSKVTCLGGSRPSGRDHAQQVDDNTAKEQEEEPGGEFADETRLASVDPQLRERGELFAKQNQKWGTNYWQQEW